MASVFIEYKGEALECLLDDKDLITLEEERWKYSIRSNGSMGGTYVQLTKLEGPITMSCLLHRLLINPKEGMFVDHKNGNPLDNRRENLRECTPAQNQWNKKPSKRKHKHTDYLGISWSSAHSKWQARCGGASAENRYLGRYDSEEEAARAYDTMARKAYGEFAKLNFPLENKEVIYTKNYKSSKFRGVFKPDDECYWSAHIMINKKRILLGKFSTELEAALAYDEASVLYRGPSGYRNIIEENA